MNDAPTTEPHATGFRMAEPAPSPLALDCAGMDFWAADPALGDLLRGDEVLMKMIRAANPDKHAAP